MVNKALVKISASVKPLGKLKPKSTASARLKTALEKAVDASTKLTSNPTAAKHALSFEFDGELQLECVGKQLKGKMATSLSELPKKGVFGTGTITVATEVLNPAKIDNDIDFAIDYVAKEFKAKLVKQFESRVP